MARTLLLLHFNESTHAGATDAMGNLEPLNVSYPGFSTALVSVEPAFAGYGRRMNVAEAIGLGTVDAAGRSTLTTRDLTVQALVSLEDAPVTDRWLYSRGSRAVNTAGVVGQAAAAVGIRRFATLADHYEVWLEWHTTSGVRKKQPSATFIAPPAGRFFLLTVTRRWESPSSVTTRYYVNDRRIGMFTTTDGDIGGATTGITYVGTAYTEWGGRDHVWPGVLDELRVTDYETSAEEVEATWRRLSVHQDQGVALVASMMPPGSGWTADPGTRWGKLIIGAGQALALPWASIDEVHDTWLPTRAYDEQLARWEAIYQAPRGQLDSLDQRRQRVASLSARENSYAPPQVLTMLEEALNRPASAMTLLSFTNTIRDTFATLNPQRWHAEPAGAWTAAGAAAITRAAGSDLRWTAAIRNAPWLLTSLSTVEPQRLVAACRFAGLPTVEADVIAGLHLANWRTGDGVWFGFTAGDGLSMIAVLGGVAQPQVNFVTPGDGYTPIWLTARRDIGPNGENPRRWIFAHAAAEAGPYTEFEHVFAADFEPEWAGLGVIGTDAATADTTTLAVDEFVLHEPKGTRALSWYVLVAAGLGEDLALANLILQKIKPAHTHAAAITSTTLLTDTAGHGVDRGPMGGL